MTSFQATLPGKPDQDVTCSCSRPCSGRHGWLVGGHQHHAALQAVVTSDWRFALTTALVADMAYRGNNAAATELRNREKVMGTTMEFRRDLRIRYVEPANETAASAGVASLDDYRDL